MKTVFVSGNFNILHPGHQRLLRFASELGDRLIVGVNSDRIAGHAAHVPEQYRLEGVRNNSWVSEVILLDQKIEIFLEKLRPDIVVKGKEHVDQPNPEKEVIKKYGGRLVFGSGEAIFSSLDLIRKNLFDTKFKLTHFPSDYASRHQFTRNNLIAHVKKFSDQCICVIGDLIIDEYIICEPLGMSQEDPTIVVTPIDTQRFIGGAGIVASHAAGLGAKVHFLSVSGQDDAQRYAQEELRRYGVEAYLAVDQVRPTTIKQRFQANEKTLLRVSRLHQGSIETTLQNQIIQEFHERLSKCDLVIFSDFNYGCLPQSLVDQIIARCQKKGVMMAADSQCSSQIGDVSRFQGMHLLTPTEREARISLRNYDDGLVVLAEELRIKSKAKNIILKLGSEGALLHVEMSKDTPTDRIPALNHSLRDVAGAGDSMLVTSAIASMVGANPWEAACLGSISAAIQVSRLGNIPLSRKELIKELEE